MTQIRQPIVTIAGHVDHGKTTILDSIRSTCVAKKEAGGITQKISFTVFPSDILSKKCCSLLNEYGIKLELPGFLFIDTPGHAAFSNLRRRGGALADLAILVVDINEGLMPQTIECIEILKENKTPFIVALNKIDAISGWTKRAEKLKESIDKQSDFVKTNFEDKLYKIIAALSSHCFDSDLFFRVKDFTKQLALIPCSGKTGEGIPELLMMLSGLSQRFLEKQLQLHKEGRGTILEVKREKIIMCEAILYDGTLSEHDTIVVAGLEKPTVTKIRALFEAMPIQGFKNAKKVHASAGVQLYLQQADVLPGMPFVVVPKGSKEKEIEKIKHDIQKEVSETIKTDRQGIVIKAESLGSLEALIILLRKAGIKIGKAGIGDISKTDLISASSNLREKPLDSIVLGFNVGLSEDANVLKLEMKEADKIKVIVHDVIYHLIEDLEKWRQVRAKEIEREAIAGLTLPCKLKVLKYIFHQSKPAIFGVKVENGILKSGIHLMNDKGKVIDKIKAVQEQNKSVESVARGKEVAISMPNTTYGRQVREDDMLYSAIDEDEFKKLKENKRFLSQDEILVLQEIAEIKRKEKPTWGI